MTETDPTQIAGAEALELLRLMLVDDDASDASRVSAAKALLDRFTPKENAELKRREDEERAKAIAEARCLLAELAAAQLAGADEPHALAEIGAAGTDHAANDAAG